jgi:hypothetical protein
MPTCEKDCKCYKGPGECDDGSGTIVLGPGQTYGCSLCQSKDGKREEMLTYLKTLKIFPKSITCDKCGSATDGSWESAYDPYNTDGDCLAVK